MENYSGTLRISNPKTLQRWIDTGKFQELKNEGYFFGIGCGRFRIEKCFCSKCVKRPNTELKKIIDKIENI